jgi:hypothetical protein
MNIYKVNILDKNKNIIDYEWFDGYNNKSLGKDCKDEDTKIIINEFDEGSIDIKDTTYYELCTVPVITSIKTGAAIITEICYSKKIIGYDLENTDKSSIDKKKVYDNALKELNQAILNETTSRTNLKELQDKCRAAYLDYNNTLDIAIQEAERR